MTSSTRHSDRLRSLLAVSGIAVLAWGVCVGLLGSLATHAETRWGAFLWAPEEWMQLFSAGNYARRGRGRILVIGPSEAREALVPEPFEAAIPGFEFFNDSMSYSTLEDGITQLEYIEREYGADAVPEILILAVTQRYVLDFAPGDRPFAIAIDKYSPSLWLDESVEPQELVPKRFGSGLVSRIRLVGHSGSRYRAAIRSLLARIMVEMSGAEWHDLVSPWGLVPYRYHHMAHIADAEFYREETARGQGLYVRLRDMRAETRASIIAQHFERLRALVARHETRVVVLNMPEASWRRSFYAPGVYDNYLSVLRRAADTLGLFDLRTAMPDEQYFDWLHLDREGAYSFSRQVADVLASALSTQHRPENAVDQPLDITAE